MLRVILHLQGLISSQVNSHHRVISILLAELHHLWRPAWKRQHQDSGGSICKGHTFSIFLIKSWSYNYKARGIFFGLFQNLML